MAAHTLTPPLQATQCAPGARRKRFERRSRSRSRSTSPRRSPRRRLPRLDCCGAGSDDTGFDWRSAPPARLSERFRSRGSLSCALLRRCSWLGASFGPGKGRFESWKSEEEATRRRSTNWLLPPQSCPKSSPLLRPSFSKALDFYFYAWRQETPVSVDTSRREREKRACERSRARVELSFLFFFFFDVRLLFFRSKTSKDERSSSKV